MRRTSVGVIVLLLTGAFVATTSVAHAACPQRRAAEMTAELVTGQPTGDEYKFIWAWDGGFLDVGPNDTVVLEFAIIPFSEGTTSVWLNSVEDNTAFTFFALSFDGDGTTNDGIAYDEDMWNDVRVVLDFETQEYTTSINGESASDDFINPNGQFDDVDDLTGPNIGLFNVNDTEPAPAWLDSMRLTKRSQGTTETMFAALFDGDPEFTPTYGSLEFRDPETTQISEGRCVTTTTVNVDKGRDRIRARGRLLPPHPGSRMIVTLLRKKGDRFVKLDTNRPVLNSESRYATGFERPSNARRCRVKATFAFDVDHLGSSAQETFRC